MLQREDLERTTKEKPYSLRTVGYGWVRMGNGGRKRVAWEGNTERLVRIESFLLVENWLLRIARQGLCKRKLLVVKKTAFECII